MDSAAIQPSETDEAEIKDVSNLIKCRLLCLLTLVCFPKRCAEIMEMFLLFRLILACFRFIFITANAAFEQAEVSLPLERYSGRTEALRVFMLRP